MQSRTSTIGPKTYARIAGLFYLVNIACGMFGELSRGRLIAVGDAAATAHNILTHSLLFRAGIAGDLVMHITDIPVTIIFYYMLRPVSRDLSGAAALFGMLQTAILCANKLNLVAVTFLLGGEAYLNAYTPAQLHAQTSLLLTLHESGFGVGLVFFGVSCLITGYLIYRSGFLPRTLGVLQALAGICYLTNSFALLLDPLFAAKLFPGILLPAFVGELGTCLWLLVKGVSTAGWEERLKLGPEILTPADADCD